MSLPELGCGCHHLLLFFKEQNEINEYPNSDKRRHIPDVRPVMRAIGQFIFVYNDPREPGTDEHSYAIGGKSEKPLRRIFYLFPGLFFCIHIPGDKKEIVTNPM